MIVELMTQDTPQANPSNPLGEPSQGRSVPAGGIDPALITFLNEIKEKWPDIEEQLESVSQWDDDLKKKLSEYIDDLKGEIKTLKIIRWLAIGTAGVTILILMGVLICFLFFHPYFFQANPYAGAALIIASISAIVLILRAALAGSFASLKDRNKGEMSAKSLVEAADHAKSLSELAGG